MECETCRFCRDISGPLRECDVCGALICDECANGNNLSRLFVLCPEHYEPPRHYL